MVCKMLTLLILHNTLYSEFPIDSKLWDIRMQIRQMNTVQRICAHLLMESK